MARNQSRFDINEENEDDDSGEPRCPFCDSDGDCEHLLASVDFTFEEINGGALYGMLEVDQVLNESIALLWRELGSQPWKATAALLKKSHLDHLLELIHDVFQGKWGSVDDLPDCYALFLSALHEILTRNKGTKEIEIVDDSGVPGFASSCRTYWNRKACTVAQSIRQKIEQDAAKLKRLARTRP